MQRYIMSLGSSGDKLIVGVPFFRVTELVTNVAEMGQGTITGFFINGDNQFVQSADAWLFSAKHIGECQREFLRQHGLENKSFDFIDEYLDSKGISFPKPNAIVLPNLRANDRVWLTGNGTFITALVGWAG